MLLRKSLYIGLGLIETFVSQPSGFRVFRETTEQQDRTGQSGEMGRPCQNIKETRKQPPLLPRSIDFAVSWFPFLRSIKNRHRSWRWSALLP